MDAVTGVLLPDEAELRRRVGRLSLEQKIRLLTGADFWALYAEPELLHHFQVNGMFVDFSWDRTASEFVSAYQRAVAAPQAL